MPMSECCIRTTNASRYIQKLCRHFAHKIEVSFDDVTGCCQLPSAQVNMNATDTTLTFKVIADTTEGIETAKYVVEDHFHRFSRSENIESLVWNAS